MCPVTAPTLPLMLDAAAIDTDGADCIATSPDVAACVVAGTEVTVGTIKAGGSRPLIILGTTSVVVAGAINAASRRGGSSGPGANPALCDGGTPPTGMALAFGGGHGGSFGGSGGGGGGVGLIELVGDVSDGGAMAAAATPPG